MIDVRITRHKATRSNAEFLTVTFYEGLEDLIGTAYVKLKVEDSRLYFYSSEKKVKGAVKVKRYTQVQREFESLVKFVGVYPIKWDSKNSTYYVCLEDRQDVSIRNTNSKVPHPNYKSHKNEPYEEEEMIKPVYEVEVIDTKYPVYEALMALLMSQIKCKEYQNAVFTTQTIQNMLEREN